MQAQKVKVGLIYSGNDARHGQQIDRIDAVKDPWKVINIKE